MPRRTAILATMGILVLIAVGVRLLPGEGPHEQPAGSTPDRAPAVAVRASSAPYPTPTASAGSPAATTTPRPGTTTGPPATRPTAPATQQARPSRTPASSPAGAPTTPSAPSPLPPTLAPTPLPAPSLDFVLSSFNVLGASHTTATGKRPGMASGPVRAVRAAELIRRDGADVVGFQELQADQLTTLEADTDLDFYPGLSMRRQDSENSIGWRRDEWVPVELHTARLPYFDGSPRAMPFVRLRNLSSGLEVWFGNFH